MSDSQTGANAPLDLDRLVYAWEAGEDYDPSWATQPWDDPSELDAVASNSIAAGWAARVGRCILIEEVSGRHVAELYETAGDAERAWPDFERQYDEPPSEHLDPPSDLDGEIEL